MTTYTHQNVGTCSRSTTVTLLEDGTIDSIVVEGGCNGNLKGVAALLKGMQAQDAIDKMTGLECGFRGTSCPDQISIALREALEQL